MNPVSPSTPDTILLIGFSFSLTADGSPSSCNEAIAHALWQAYETWPAETQPLLGLQWELCDALTGDKQVQDELEAHLPAGRIATPPHFEVDDILGLERLLHAAAGDTPAMQALTAYMPTLVDQALSTAETVALFNHCLDDRTFFAQFTPFLELDDLYRPDKGPMGHEKRRLPYIAEYPVGLRRFQAQRVNRLILEKLFSPMLRRGRYLNTYQVSLKLLSHVLGNGRVPRHIHIYAHPAHHAWCRHNLLRAAAELSLHPDSFKLFWGETAAGWDATTAQVWCRSQANWDLYMQMLDMPK